MSNQTIKLLEQKINDLILLCKHMDEENKSLKDAQAQWTAEKQQLISKNESAKKRITDMINQLKTLESPS